MKKVIDKTKFGPWVIIAGASSGFGKEFAHQLAADGLNLVLVARRINLLEDLGKSLAKEFGIQYQTIEADLAEESSIKKIAEVTKDIDIGFLIANAGGGTVGKFLSFDEKDIKSTLQLAVMNYASLIHHFGRRLEKRGKGGILLMGAMGAAHGIPYLLKDSAPRAYIEALGKGLHYELKKTGVHVTVLLPGTTQTPALDKLLHIKQFLPMKPGSLQPAVKEALLAFSKNRITIIPGLMNRLMDRFTPGSIVSKLVGGIMKKSGGIMD